jgi:pSer/pThr/pTyr-binding forkhead associated (FHA) protein
MMTMSSQAAGSTGDPLARHSLSPGELRRMLAAERTGEPFLAMRDGDGEFRLVTLDPRAAAVTLGRHTGMDVSLAWDAEVSGVHAELRRLGEEWTVADDGLSRNGTFLNGERVGGRQRLRPGDRLLIGRTIIAFCGDAVEPSEATVASGELPEAPQLNDTQRRILVALCRPYLEGAEFPAPTSNQQIASEVFLGIDAVKRHLRNLFQSFGVGQLPQNQKRARLAELALRLGLVSQRDLPPG